MLMPFGNYKNRDLEDVPSDYIRFLLESGLFDKEYPQLVKSLDEEYAYRTKWKRHFNAEEKP